MGFDTRTLLSLPFGLLLPAIILVYMFFKKTKQKKAYDSIYIGFGVFFASIAAVAAVFLLVNTFFLSTLRFSDETSGLTIVGTIIVIMILTVYIVCEAFKVSVIKKFVNAEFPRAFSALGFTAGIIIAQNAVVFVVNNLIGDLTKANIIFYGIILFVTGIIYAALSCASEVMIKEGYKRPAFILSGVYYLFWVAVIVFVNSTVLLYISTIALFVVSLILSGVFIFKFKKK